ncbi:hypothetical protein Tcan_00808, partial [Toxocara canis]
KKSIRLVTKYTTVHTSSCPNTAFRTLSLHRKSSFKKPSVLVDMSNVHGIVVWKKNRSLLLVKKGFPSRNLLAADVNRRFNPRSLLLSRIRFLLQQYKKMHVWSHADSYFYRPVPSDFAPSSPAAAHS